jgi:hypothetical protein
MKEAYLVRRLLHQDADVFLADGNYRSGRVHRLHRRHPDLLDQALADDRDGSLGLNGIVTLSK